MAKRKSRSGSRDVTRGGDVPRTFETRTGEFNYRRLESMVPMRDGVKLFTLILIPEGVAGKMPIVLTRTPYDAKGRVSRSHSPDIAMVLPAADEALVRDGYIRVYQDVRGRFGSKGKYTMTMPVRGPSTRAGWTRSPTPGTRSSGWWRTSRATTAASASPALPTTACSP